ncbi:MAG: uroporphyrinogen decarboxylase family protein [Eggerthellaceae bacterium]|nr:uroporphyrinogen decarboxylase family protein [Eggerthellaceae bacterium]
MPSNSKFSNMYNWCNAAIATRHKVPQPIATFPAAAVLGSSVERLSKNPVGQAIGIKLMAEKYDMRIAMGYMDLSAEAEAFGAECIYHEDEIPTISGALVTDEDEADALVIPEVGTGRTGSYLLGIEMALHLIKDRPVFAECIGPFSLAGRLVDITEAMVLCYEEPDMMHTVLDKATTFIIDYIKAYKALGAHGIMVAEPLAGILSPALVGEFSCDYMKRIVEECQDKNFVIFYHNCGNNTVLQAEEIFDIGCKGYHFGDKITLKEMLEKAPEDVLVMGNVSPSEEFFGGTKASIRKATYEVMHDCYRYDNFWLSSGCDVPALTDPSNIEEFFSAAYDYYTCHDMLEELQDEFDFEEMFRRYKF